VSAADIDELRERADHAEVGAEARALEGAPPRAHPHDPKLRDYIVDQAAATP
jgi:hypothetical protein